MSFEVCLLPRDKALTFADHLCAMGIAAKAEPGLSGHWKVVTESADDAARAKRELLKFAGSPFDSSFTQASWEKGGRDPQFKFVKPRLFGMLAWDPFTVTSAIEILCLLFFAGQLINEPWMLSVFSLNRMQGPELPWGAYRLLTPAFLHFGIIHIAFNLVMWEALARPVERVMGPAKLLVLAVSVALISNVLEYAALPYEGVFGGLSGVVYGIIGYLGVVSRRPDAPPALGFPRGLLAVSVIFILFGFLTGGIANFCHLGGLALGLLWGLWDRRKPGLFGKA
ncbi:MAG: rhomboid family intramembrane serine protease [Succinivibrio sp.]|jgi:GlpG protein|nr:rhomboid family intramembrane serine protease [Succinivibrio sp.]